MSPRQWRALPAEHQAPVCWGCQEAAPRALSVYSQACFSWPREPAEATSASNREAGLGAKVVPSLSASWNPALHKVYLPTGSGEPGGRRVKRRVASFAFPALSVQPSGRHLQEVFSVCLGLSSGPGISVGSSVLTDPPRFPCYSAL